MKRLATGLLIVLLAGCPIIGNMLTNGDFKAGTNGIPDAWQVHYGDGDWGVEWEWDGTGSAAHVPGNTFALVQQSYDMAIPVLPGVEYVASYTVAGRTAGSAVLQIGGVEAFEQGVTPISADGRFTQVITCPEDVTGTYLAFVPSEDFDGAFSNVVLSIKAPS